jgi:hypothetical protein
VGASSLVKSSDNAMLLNRVVANVGQLRATGVAQSAIRAKYRPLPAAASVSGYRLSAGPFGCDTESTTRAGVPDENQETDAAQSGDQ